MNAATKHSWIVLFVYACSSVPLPEKSLYVAEGEHHVASWSEQDASSLSRSDQLAALTAEIRAAHGNVGVYVMRAERRANFVVILTIWESAEDLAAWRKSSGESGRGYDVLLEATK